MKELKNFLTTFCNRAPPEHEVEALAAKLSHNEDGLVKWDEFVAGVQAATGTTFLGSAIMPKHSARYEQHSLINPKLAL